MDAVDPAGVRLFCAATDDGRSVYSHRKVLSLMCDDVFGQGLGVSVRVGTTFEKGMSDGVELIVCHPTVCVCECACEFYVRKKAIHTHNVCRQNN